jgi:catalase
MEKNQQATESKVTTTTGVALQVDDASLRVVPRGPVLGLEDFETRDKIMHFDHERIPERVVHARGTGAHGIFTPTRSMTEYTSAKFLAVPGVETPVFVRFS